VGTSEPRSASKTKVSHSPSTRCATSVATDHKTRDHKLKAHKHPEDIMESQATPNVKKLPSHKLANLWKGMRRSYKSKMALAHNTKDGLGFPVVWEQHIGKPTPPIFTMVPLEYVQTPEKVDMLKEMTANLLGIQDETSIITDETNAPTGEMLFRVRELSKEGARKLTRGYWSPVPPKKDQETDPRGFFTHQGQTIGTIEKPKYIIKQDNSIEVRWDPEKPTTNGTQCPNRAEIYEALERAEKQMYYEGIGLDPTEWIGITTGNVEEEGEDTVIKTDFGAGWRMAQARVIHAHTPAYVIFHGDRESPPILSHTGRDHGSKNQRAKSDSSAFRIRFPKGYYKENQNMIRQVAEQLGIELKMDSHPYPQYAIRDILDSLENGQPMREGQICNSRALIKINSVIANTCQGLTDPTMVTAWLHKKCGMHYVAAGMREELTTKGDAPAATTYAYGVLVDIADPTQLMKLTNHRISGSDAVTIRRWGRMDKGKLKILQNELYVADGAVSVVPQKLQTATRATSACDLLTTLTEEAKQTATRAGLDQSGYAATTQQQTVSMLNLQKRLDLAAWKSRMRELEAQVQALDKEEKQQEEAKKAEAEEQEKAKEPVKKAESPSKQKRSELEVRIVLERGDDLQLTIDTEDVAPETGQRATLQDIVKHLYDMECFGSDYGIDPAPLPGKKGADIEVKVYVEAEFEGSHGNWAHTVGKDALVKTIKIDQLHGGTLTLSPRVAQKPSKRHLDWLKATVGEAPTPSPAKPKSLVTTPSQPKNDSSNRNRRTNQDSQATDSKLSTPQRWKKTKPPSTPTPRRCSTSSERNLIPRTPRKQTFSGSSSRHCARACRSLKKREQNCSIWDTTRPPWGHEPLRPKPNAGRTNPNLNEKTMKGYSINKHAYQDNIKLSTNRNNRRNKISDKAKQKQKQRANSKQGKWRAVSRKEGKKSGRSPKQNKNHV
jgi:hypothetical protein